MFDKVAIIVVHTNEDEVRSTIPHRHKGGETRAAIIVMAQKPLHKLTNLLTVGSGDLETFEYTQPTVVYSIIYDSIRKLISVLSFSSEGWSSCSMYC